MAISVRRLKSTTDIAVSVSGRTDLEVQLYKYIQCRQQYPTENLSWVSNSVKGFSLGEGWGT